ncbi:Arabinose efflux permease family protein [Hyella patelloides LEGE 07179]|uniref:Arabinose efflux permease family protein n=1 Tax=Hyella patelloides LEGE 07179 TaxID=945734 RepID=A0A563W3I0_9CYAN|nr:MFS transporter [Hyella patelloides]VEP18197.1 Arabinose efflux permease family protein [Hyella patelloides LEGE 07179]
MRTFLIVWLGQLISLLGSKLTEFALGFWILEQTYRETGTITQFAITILLIYLPKVVVSPFAGVIIDRWNRRSAMVLSDTVTGIVAIAVMVLVTTQKLAIWHIYIAITITSIFNAFQTPAYLAAISQIVPQKHLSRANGMVQVSIGVAKIASPFIAGLLMKFVGLQGILTIDAVTFVIAIISLATVRFPNLKRTKLIKRSPIEQFVTDTISGWNYIATRPGLLRLLSFVAISYFTTGMLEVILWPLLYEPNSTERLGSILSIGGCGVLVGSLLMSVWGGGKNRVLIILACIALQGLVTLGAGLKISLVVLALGIFLYLFAQPIIISSNQAIWQSKVPARLQGRVFALQQSLERALAICAYITAGPLVDNVLNPLMSQGSFLERFLGRFIGSGIDQRAGISLLLILLGTLNLIIVAIAFQVPRLRHLEKELPDRNFPQSQLKLSSMDSNQSLSRHSSNHL